MKVYAVMIFHEKLEPRLDYLYESKEAANVRVSRLCARGLDARCIKRTLIEEHDDFPTILAIKKAEAAGWTTSRKKWSPAPTREG